MPRQIIDKYLQISYNTIEEAIHLEHHDRPAHLPDQQEPRKTEVPLVERWKRRIEKEKTNAAAAAAELGLPPEKIPDVMSVMYGTQEQDRDEEIEKALVLVDDLRKEVQTMEEAARSELAENEHFANNEQHAIEILYGDDGSSIVSLYRRYFPLNKHPR